MNTVLQHVELNRITDRQYVLTQYCLLKFTSLVDI